MRRLWTYMARHRRDLTVAVVAAVLGSICQTLVPLVERAIVDGAVAPHGSSLLPPVLALLGLGLGIFGFAYLRRYRGGRVSWSVQYDLRNAMHDHLQEMDFDNLDRLPTGQLVARANSDTTLVQGMLSFLPILSGNVLMMVLSLGVMVYLSPLLAVVSIVVAPSLLVVSYRMRWRIFPATWDAQQREGDVAQIVDEAVNGVRVVKAFGQQRRELDRLVAAAQRLYGSQMRSVRLQARYQPLLEALPSVGQVGILALGGVLVIDHRISIGTFLAFSTYVSQLVAPSRMLAGILTVGQQARAGVERIFQLLDLEPSIRDRPGAEPLGEIDGTVELSGVTFSYEEGPTVLHGVDLRLAPGERVALVGPSGSGKSTIAMLLGRFYDPEEGSVRVGGHDVRDVTSRSLRRQIGFVFEESFLFSDSIKANVAFGRPDATDAEVETAARVAAAHEFILALPDGYDTVVGERGLSLSGGQRQRIALARAVLSDPSVLVLDDATSAVDAKVEEEIHEGLSSVLAGRTTLLVAHRRSTLHLADRVVLLEEGRITDTGTHDELFEHNARYRSLVSGLAGEAAEGEPAEADRRARPGSPAAVPPLVAAPGNGAGRAVAGNGAGRAVAGNGAGAVAGRRRVNLELGPELVERVARLQPVRDVAEVSVSTESRRDSRFSLRRLLGEFRRPLSVGLVLVVLDGVLSLAGPIFVKQGVDSGVATGSVAIVLTASALFLAATLADLVTQVGATFVTGRLAQRVMLSLRIRIWAQLQRLSLDYYEREMAGRIMTRMTTDVDQFESLVENGLLAALVSMVTFVGVGVALVVIDAELGLLTLSVAVPLAVATVAFRRRAVWLYDLARERLAVVNAAFQESLAGARESQAFVHEEETVGRFHHLGRSYLDTRIAAQRLVATYFPFVQFLSILAITIVLGVGADLVRAGALTTGALIAFVLYIELFFSPIQQLSQVFDSWQRTKVSVARIAELMRMDTLTPAPVEPVEAGRLRGEISFDRVNFAYPSSRRAEALTEVDLEIAAGETLALVGETGAGKSTIVKLMARFYDPDRGAVKVDGLDLRHLEPSSFHGQLGYVPQEAFLFSGTVRDNVAYGRPGATTEEIAAACRAVGADRFIASLPGGYDHELPERGRSLSSGQRQLLALARAELVDPAILLLDEATSNLDLVTEARVSAAMQRVASGRTTVVIAHRLQTAAMADRVVVVEGGRVVEDGSHDELIERGGAYATMWEAFESGATGASEDRSGAASERAS